MLFSLSLFLAIISLLIMILESLMLFSMRARFLLSKASWIDRNLWFIRE